jgi:CrcB protein
MARLLWICLGGALGTGARYLVSGWALALLGTSFPYGTLAVNLLGSFLLGATMSVGLSTEWLPPAVRLALTAGALGGFTTYSTFSYETMRLLQDGAWLFAGLNVALTVTLCLAASFLGFAVGGWLVGGG